MSRATKRPSGRPKFDSVIAALFVALLCVGLVLSLATSADAANRFDVLDPNYFFKRQLMFAGLSVIVFAILSQSSAVILRRLAILGVIMGICVLGVVLSFGNAVNGSQRWIRLGGLSLQPSELVKPCFVVALAWFFARAEFHGDRKWYIAGIVLTVILVMFFLAQPDVGQAFLLVFGASIVVYSFGIRLRYLLVFGGLSFGALGVLYLLMDHVRRRIDLFFAADQGASYQTQMALNAVESGGLMGVGMGQGVWKSKLPDAHTDFVFSVLGEEFGLIGLLILVALYAALCVRLLINASFVADNFKRAAILSLVSLLALQALINMGVNLALLPAKGMTLPFISYGGSSMIGCAITLGFACSLVKNGD